jgi:hypothetical protein
MLTVAAAVADAVPTGVDPPVVSDGPAVDPADDPDDNVMVCAAAPVNGAIVPNPIGTAVTTVAATRRAPRRDGMLMKRLLPGPQMLLTSSVGRPRDARRETGKRSRTWTRRPRNSRAP